MAIILSLVALPVRAAGPEEDVAALRDAAHSSLEIGEPEAALEKLLLAHGKATDDAMKLEIAVEIARVRVQVFRVTGDKSQLGRAETLLVTQLESLGPNDLRRAGVTAALDEIRAVAGNSTETTGGVVAEPSTAEPAAPQEPKNVEEAPFFTSDQISKAAARIEAGKPLPECADPSSAACRTLLDKGSAALAARGKRDNIFGGVMALVGITVGVPVGAWLLVTGVKLKKLEDQCDDSVLGVSCSNGSQGRIVGGSVAVIGGVLFLFIGAVEIARGNKKQAKATRIRNEHQLSIAPVLGRSQAGITFGGRF